MKQVRDQIKNDVQDCKAKGERFHMPTFDREDVVVKESILKPCGLTRYKSKYRISLGKEDWIQVEYSSKSPCRTAQTNADRSVVKVTSSDPSLNFTEEWDEKA